MPGIAYKAQTWRAQTSPSRSYPHHFKLYATANHTQLDMLCNGQACLPLMNGFSTTSVTMHTLFLHSGYRKCESSEQAYAHLTTRRPFTDGTNVRSSNYGHTSQWRSNCAHTQAFCLTHHLPLIKKKSGTSSLLNSSSLTALKTLSTILCLLDLFHHQNCNEIRKNNTVLQLFILRDNSGVYTRHRGKDCQHSQVNTRAHKYTRTQLHQLTPLHQSRAREVKLASPSLHIAGQYPEKTFSTAALSRNSFTQNNRRLNTHAQRTNV